MIGILAVQGDFEAHAAMLAGMGVNTREVRTPPISTAATVSSCREGKHDAVAIFAGRGSFRRDSRIRVGSGAIFGTCAERFFWRRK